MRHVQWVVLPDFGGFDKVPAADASAARTGRLRCEADYYITCDLFIYRSVFLFSFHLCCLFLHRGFLWLWQAGVGWKSSNSQWGL